METKKQANKNCSRCRYYEGYYYKAYCQFCRSNWGFCEKHKKSVECDNGCELWERKYISRRIDKPIVLHTLTKALTDIAVLSQIFTEEKEI